MLCEIYSSREEVIYDGTEASPAGEVVEGRRLETGGVID